MGYVVGGCNVQSIVAILSMADMVCLAMQKLWSALVCMVCMVCTVHYGLLEFKLRCEYLLLLNMADMD